MKREASSTTLDYSNYYKDDSHSHNYYHYDSNHSTDDGCSVVRCGGGSALWITKCVDGYGTVAVHIQMQTLYSNGGVCPGNKSSQICYQL